MTNHTIHLRKAAVRTSAELEAGGQRRGVHDAHVAQQQRAALAYQDQRHSLRGAQALRQDLQAGARLAELLDGYTGSKAHQPQPLATSAVASVGPTEPLTV